MQKNSNAAAVFSGNSVFKNLLMMKLTVLFSLIFSFQSIGSNIAAQNIDIELKNVSVEAAIKAIEAQGNYRFVYKNEMLPKNKLVSLSAKNAQLNYVLGNILQNTPLSYEVINNTLIVIVAGNEKVAKTILGKVTDIDGNPLSGVSIIEKGTTNGTTSKEDGSFSLNVNAEGAILLFSSTGFISRELHSGNNMVVMLEKVNEELEQVVIVGYGVQKKTNLTGAVSTVDFDKESMKSRAISNVSSALAGMASGISVRQSNGLPRDNNVADLSVRGVGSLNISSAPLVLIDGQVASIGSVSPNDVASVSILKDAASASIYGSRASNGVILITTKTGKGANGKVTFSYNGYTGWKTPTLLPDYVYNTPNHMRLNNMVLINSGLTPFYTDAQISEWEAGIKTDPLKYPSTNWWNAVIKKNMIYSHNISARGGNEKINFYSSLDYYKDDGMIYNSAFSRFSFRNNLNYKVNNWLKFGNNITYSPYVSGPVDISDVFNFF